MNIYFPWAPCPRTCWRYSVVFKFTSRFRTTFFTQAANYSVAWSGLPPRDVLLASSNCLILPPATRAIRRTPASLDDTWRQVSSSSRSREWPLLQSDASRHLHTGDSDEAHSVRFIKHGGRRIYRRWIGKDSEHFSLFISCTNLFRLNPIQVWIVDALI